MSRGIGTIVDDTETGRIQYFGDWKATTPQALSVDGVLDYAFNNTLHGVNANNTGFTFRFEGALQIMFLLLY
jgi:hypothetical protein